LLCVAQFFSAKSPTTIAYRVRYYYNPQLEQGDPAQLQHLPINYSNMPHARQMPTLCNCKQRVAATSTGVVLGLTVNSHRGAPR
jgi:hypothetical protein